MEKSGYARYTTYIKARIIDPLSQQQQQSRLDVISDDCEQELLQTLYIVK